MVQYKEAGSGIGWTEVVLPPNQQIGNQTSVRSLSGASIDIDVGRFRLLNPFFAKSTIRTKLGPKSSSALTCDEGEGG